MTHPVNGSSPPRASPRGRSGEYFEESLAAERYAKLICRPHASTDKGFRERNLAMELSAVELERRGELCGKEKCLPSSIGMTSTTASGCSTPSLFKSSSKQSMHDVHSIGSGFQDFETVLSLQEKLAALQVELEEQKLSALHKRALAEGAGSDELDKVIDSENQKEAYIQLVLEKIGEKARKKPATMSLALRRVIASLGANEDCMVEDMMQDLQAAVSASTETVNKFQGARSPRGNQCHARNQCINGARSPHSKAHSPRDAIYNYSPRCHAGKWIN